MPTSSQAMKQLCGLDENEMQQLMEMRPRTKFQNFSNIQMANDTLHAKDFLDYCPSSPPSEPAGGLYPPDREINCMYGAMDPVATKTLNPHLSLPAIGATADKKRAIIVNLLSDLPQSERYAGAKDEQSLLTSEKSAICVPGYAESYRSYQESDVPDRHVTSISVAPMGNLSTPPRVQGQQRQTLNAKYLRDLLGPSKELRMKAHWESLDKFGESGDACGLLTFNPNTGRHEWKLMSSDHQSLARIQAMRGYRKRRTFARSASGGTPASGRGVSPWRKNIQRQRAEKLKLQNQAPSKMLYSTRRMRKDLSPSDIINISGLTAKLPSSLYPDIEGLPTDLKGESYHLAAVTTQSCPAKPPTSPERNRELKIDLPSQRCSQIQKNHPQETNYDCDEESSTQRLVAPSVSTETANSAITTPTGLEYEPESGDESDVSFNHTEATKLANGTTKAIDALQDFLPNDQNSSRPQTHGDQISSTPRLELNGEEVVEGYRRSPPTTAEHVVSVPVPTMTDLTQSRAATEEIESSVRFKALRKWAGCHETTNSSADQISLSVNMDSNLSKNDVVSEQITYIQAEGEPQSDPNGSQRVEPSLQTPTSAADGLRIPGTTSEPNGMNVGSDDERDFSFPSSTFHIPPPFPRRSRRRQTPSPDLQYGDFFDTEGSLAFPMRKDLPTPDPHKLCFVSNVTGCTHQEVMESLETSFPKVKVARIQYDPINLHNNRQDKRFKCMWLFHLSDTKDEDLLLARGFRLRGQRMSICRADDVYAQAAARSSKAYYWRMLRNDLDQQTKGPLSSMNIRNSSSRCCSSNNRNSRNNRNRRNGNGCNDEEDGDKNKDNNTIFISNEKKIKDNNNDNNYGSLRSRNTNTSRKVYEESKRILARNGGKMQSSY